MHPQWGSRAGGSYTIEAAMFLGLRTSHTEQQTRAGSPVTLLFENPFMSPRLYLKDFKFGSFHLISLHIISILLSYLKFLIFDSF